MNGTRLIGATIIFLVLGLAFSGIIGVAQADGEQGIFIPEPKIGDSAYYVVREVIEDDTIAQGQILFNWLRMSWTEETTYPDETASPQQLKALSYDLMFRQGTQYELELIRKAYYDAIDGQAEFDEVIYDSSIRTSDSCIIAACLGSPEYSDSQIHVKNRQGPVGPCGALTEIHGAKKIPNQLTLAGYCRDFRVMGLEQTTTYNLVGKTTWNDREAVEYESTNFKPFKITYAEGIPFPVKLELPLSEYISEAYSLGRHFEIELHGFEAGSQDFLEPVTRITGQPLPLVTRVKDIQIDETGLTGFTLGNAFDAAMADVQAPQLANFMTHTDAYILAAWKNIRIDENGEQKEVWNLFATNGNEALGKEVLLLMPTPDIPASIEALNQYQVSESRYEVTGPFPSIEILPEKIPLVSSALTRSVAYPGIENPNLWGFYADCLNQACSQAAIGIRTGQERIPDTASPTSGVTASPNYYQNTVFFDQDGLETHTWSMQVSQSRGLLPVPPVDESIPRNEDSSQASISWTPPSAEAVAGLGLVAAIGAAAYYFWPNLKLLFIGLFSRIKDDEVLEHPTRKRVFDEIQLEPGIHFQGLAKKVELGHGSLSHHLRKLTDAGLVQSKDAFGRKCFFPVGKVNAVARDGLALLQAKSTLAVFREIVAKPGTSAASVVERTGLSSATVSYHLTKLRNANIINAGRSLSLTPNGIDLLDHY
jgi:DNA-binding transcriptional ArsR family regulator